MDDPTLHRVEKQRLDLESNIATLRTSLRQWQTLEIDYEGLKEEFQGLPDDTSIEKCLQTAREFRPDSLDDNELEALFNDKVQGHKRPSQVVAVLSKRVEYVLRNVDTIRRQLGDAERKRNALLLAQDPNHQDEAALPLSEITEELDAAGTVISSKVDTPGKEAPTLLDVLHKAGVSDIGGFPPGNPGFTQVLNNAPDAVDTASGSRSIKPQSMSELSSHSRIEELSDEEDAVSDQAKLLPTNPDDTEEDAVLRQEMLQYGLGEVGAIVAELDLEDAADYSDDDDNADDYLSDYDENEDLYTDESEDDKGATKNPVISERYRRQMQLLSKKHGITDIKNLGPESELPGSGIEELGRPPAAEAAARAAIARDQAIKGVLKSTDTGDSLGEIARTKKTKRVGFAPSLDIAAEAREPSSPAAYGSHASPIGDVVVERSTQDTDHQGLTLHMTTQPPVTTKQSRSKAARSTEPQTPMYPPTMTFPTSSTSKAPRDGPSGRTVATTLVERPASEIDRPNDPIDFDEELHRREVAIEYQKLRNRKIHEQGGYVKGGQAENYGEEFATEAVIDEESGKPRKISRFKAARLKSST